MAKKQNNERSIAKVLEEITFILNEIRTTKLKDLEATKLTPKQEKIIESIEKDLNACTTKLGLILHTTEL